MKFNYVGQKLKNGTSRWIFHNHNLGIVVHSRENDPNIHINY